MEAPDFFMNQPTPSEGEEICDFCSSHDPQWAYPCRNHSHTENINAVVAKRDDLSDMRFERMNIKAISDGAWAACPACHMLIERGDRERLARRSAKRLLKNIDPEMARAWSLGNATEHIRRIHDAFWENREGAPTQITEMTK